MVAILVIAGGATIHSLFTTRVQNVSVSILLEPPTIDPFLQWVQQYRGTLSFTFIVDANGSGTYNTTHQWPYNFSHGWFFENMTWFRILSNYGDIIPTVPFAIQVNTPNDRIAIVNQTLNEWRTYTGHYPDGMLAYQPDTVVANFLKTKGVGYIMGYCFDQYQLDWMTERGGWQLPYYASSTNVLAPENMSKGGVVILPWVTWDWVSSFTVNHLLDGEPEDVPVGNMTTYIIDLMKASLSASSPFSYFGLSFVFESVSKAGDLPTVEQILYWIEQQHYSTMPAGEFVSWFESNFQRTPTYTVDFTSPYNGHSVEWYYSQSYRIARTNGSVVSFVDYSSQRSDPYLTGNAVVNFSAPHIGGNTMDNSLGFVIDALGGGMYRAPIRDSSVQYSGSLSDFPSRYEATSRQ